MPHQDPSQSQPKTVRQRVLNVIYFVDADKTRSFKLSLANVRLLMALFIFVAVWAGASTWIIGKLLYEREESSDKIRGYLSTIFEYQIRYNQIYEIAYPEQKMDAILADDESATSDLESGKKSEEPVKQEVVKAAPKPAPKNQPPVSKPTIEVVNSKFKANGSQLELNFSIKNTNTPAKALGYVWGVAVYKTADGQELFVGYPDAINVNSKGVAEKPFAATRYNIRRFRPVKARFESPDGKIGKFEEVKISVMDREGNKLAHTQEVSIDVGIDTLTPPSSRGAVASEETPSNPAIQNAERVSESADNADPEETILPDDVDAEGTRNPVEGVPDEVNVH